MTKYFILPILFSTIILGCGSSDSGCTTHECVDKLNGVAGGGADSGGASDVAGSSSDAGSTTGGKSTSSKSTVTGSSVGGSSSIGGSTVSPVGGATTIGGTSSLSEASSIGGSVSFGGSNATGGTSAATTTKVCIPRTCADFIPAWNSNSNVSQGTACGIISNGCGANLDCGNCEKPISDGTPNTGCGEFLEDNKPLVNELYIWSSKNLKSSNICGSRCYKVLPSDTKNYFCNSVSGGFAHLQFLRLVRLTVNL